MKRTVLAAFLALTSLILLGQVRIANKITADHQNIKGSKISLIPPKGFTEGENFLGLQQSESGSSILLVDMPGPYSKISSGITRENLLRKGVEVRKIEKLLINELPAILVTGTQRAHGNIYTKLILVFGTEKETMMINGLYPEEQLSLGDEMRKAILSVYYDAEKKINPFEAVDFMIDPSATKLKFGTSVSNAFIYSVDGKVPTQSEDKTSLIVTKSISPIVQQDRKLFSINRLKQLPFQIDSIQCTNEITIDGIAGYEIYAIGTARDSEERECIYQVILFSDNLYYILIGSTNDTTGNSLAEIKKVVGTFKRK